MTHETTLIIHRIYSRDIYWNRRRSKYVFWRAMLKTRLFTHDQRRILCCGGRLAMRIAIESIWRGFVGLCVRSTTRFPLVSHFVNAIRRETLSTAERFRSLRHRNFTTFDKGIWESRISWNDLFLFSLTLRDG